MVRSPPAVRLIFAPVVATRTGAFQARSGFGLVAIAGSAADTVAPRRSMVAMEYFLRGQLAVMDRMRVTRGVAHKSGRFGWLRGAQPTDQAAVDGRSRHGGLEFPTD